MGPVIGDILPLAIGIAVSPIPIIAAILMLLSPKAKGTSLGFLGGWVLGIAVAVVVFTLLGAIIPASDPDASKPIAGVVKILLGLGLLLLAWNNWRKRPAPGVEPPLPKWMGAIDSMTAVRGLLLGFVLSAVNPKNLLLAAGAGISVGTGGLNLGEQTIAIVIFVVLAACSVAVPVIAYLIAANKMAPLLDGLRGWLVHNNATVMAVLLLVLGVALIGKGIGSF